MPTANINGIEIYYRIEGRGDRVVMTHGSWTNADTWRALTPLLSDRSRWSHGTGVDTVAARR